MKKLATYMKPYWKAVILAPILMLVEVVADLMQPTLMADIVDKGVATGNVAYIIKLGLMMVGVAIFGIIGGIGCTIFASFAAQNSTADLRVDLFKKIQSFSFNSLDKFKTASLITRLTNDVMQIQNFALALLRIFVRAPLLCIGGIVMALVINAKLALILLFTIPLLVLSLAFIIKKGFPLFSTVQKRLDKVNAIVRENLTGIRVVKAFVRSDYEKERFADANTDLREITTKASRIMGMTMPVMMLVMNLSIIAVIWFGGIKVNTGSMKIGQVMAFINYMTQILFSLMMMAFLLMMVSRAKASADRIVEVMNTETDIANKDDALKEPITKGSVTFEHVFFRYKDAGGKPVLRDVNLEVHSGETIGILGATGSGKSTLVSLIPRFYDPIEGRVLVDGIDVRDIDLSTLRHSISMVLQESILFTGTIKENIRWGRDAASDDEIIEAAKAAQAHDFIMNFPDGYDTILGQRGVNLSGGQKQRVSIARALLKRPAVIILDDSTSAVDMVTEMRIQAALKNLLQAATTFIIAQRISSVVDADRILVLDDGEIVDIGRHTELMERCEVYRDIYFSQIGEEEV